MSQPTFWRSKLVELPKSARWRIGLSILAGLFLLLAGCATPIEVERIGPSAANRELTRSVISTGSLSVRPRSS